MNINLARLLAVPAQDDFSSEVLGNDAASLRAYRTTMLEALDLVTTPQARPYSGTSASDLSALLSEMDPFPEIGVGTSTALSEIGRPAMEHALAVSNPAAVAHLHCPVAIPALAAELLISATNQSLDSWDQSPFATMVEEKVIHWLTTHTGLPETASGCFTSGGSQSNMTALHLALEQAGADARQNGVVFTSEQSHFSIAKSAAILGMPENAVVTVQTETDGRMSVQALKTHVKQVLASGRRPIAIVATAGTTDLGAIDPLDEIADVARDHDIWMHVDAAYGGGLLFSRHRERLTGIERAQSVALDFHKMLFQPISCGVLLTADKAHFAPLAGKADYLNPEEAVFPGAPNLVERSMQTTRRNDGLKVLMTLRALGRDGLDRLICTTMDNAQEAAIEIASRPVFSLAQKPNISTLVFRYNSPHGDLHGDEVTLQVRARLFHAGIAALATTVLNGRVHFKFTLLNPNSTVTVISRILDAIETHAQTLEQDHAR